MIIKPLFLKKESYYLLINALPIHSMLLVYGIH